MLPAGRLDDMSSKRSSAGHKQIAQVAVMHAGPASSASLGAPAPKRSKHSSTLAGEADPQPVVDKTSKVRYWYARIAYAPSPRSAALTVRVCTRLTGACPELASAAATEGAGSPRHRDGGGGGRGR